MFLSGALCVNARKYVSLKRSNELKGQASQKYREMMLPPLKVYTFYRNVKLILEKSQFLNHQVVIFSVVGSTTTIHEKCFFRRIMLKCKKICYLQKEVITQRPSEPKI